MTRSKKVLVTLAIAAATAGGASAPAFADTRITGVEATSQDTHITDADTGTARPFDTHITDEKP